MVSEIEQEMNENYGEMNKLIENQDFNVKDAHLFLIRYHNFIRRMQDLEASRDLWRDKYDELRQAIKVIDICHNCEICMEHTKGGKDNGKKSNQV